MLMSTPKIAASTCPSAPPEIGSSLLGIVQDNGSVAYLSPNIKLTQALLDDFSKQGIATGKRLRFSGSCMKEDCVQWEAEHCGLADVAVAMKANLPEANTALPKCGIRDTCRWFFQDKKDACLVCKYVIRDPS
jgi:hypothetical protein